MFIVALFTIAQIWKQPKYALIKVDAWIKRMWSIHTMEYYSAFKKKEIMQYVTTWMNLKDIMLSEISQTDKDKYCMILYVKS